MKKAVMLLAVAFAAALAQAAFAPNPKGAAKALKATKGKPFKSGMVFVDGKYMPPPYTVERYGLVLRINQQQVTGPVIPWEEFAKTQEGVKVTKTQVGGDASQAASEELDPEPEEDLMSDDDDPLSDLFDDEPVTKKSKKKSSYKAKPKKPTVVTTYTFEGEFVPNDTTKALVNKINQTRAEVETVLRQGGFVCFGSYPRVTGDAGTARIVLDKLPGLMQTAPNAKALAQGIRASGISFFSDELCRDLYRNRVDYRALLERQKAAKEEEQMNALINGRGY